jgi:hypothetical protein
MRYDRPVCGIRLIFHLYSYIYYCNNSYIIFFLDLLNKIFFIILLIFYLIYFFIYCCNSYMAQKKTFSTRVDESRIKALKHLAVDTDKSLGVLLEEAIADLVRKYEKKGIRP